MDNLDIEWIRQEERIEKSYDMFYKTNVKTVWISALYINECEIVFVNREKYSLHEGSLRREDIVECTSKIHKNKYKIESIAKFNYTISPEQIINSDYSESYLSTISDTQDVVFHDTISYFTELNELFIILKPLQERCARSSTKKSKILCIKKTRRLRF
jgi:hypothetical protein